MTTSDTADHQIGRDGSSGSSSSMSSTISQSSTLQQGLVQGASQSRSSDITTSNSVINSSSSAATVQSGDQQWLESSLSSWDKQPGSQSNTPRLDQVANNPATTSQFSWSSQPFPSSSSSFSSNSDAQVTNKWGNTNNSSNMQSAWGSQSPNLNKQQLSKTSEWSMPTVTTSTAQWGMPPSSATEDESSQNSWGQPQRLPNAGTDGWGQTVPSGQANTPSSAPAQLSQWDQPTAQPSSTSAWPAAAATPSTTPGNQPPASSNTSSGSIVSSSTVTQSQWGATTSAGQPNTISPPTSSATSMSAFTSSQQESTTTPTSWAGAAAKGLPKAAPKPPEPIDPVRLALEQKINDPEGWGRVPVRQDTCWGKPPEKNKQDESNQWHSTQNNGTAIWESSKSSSGQTPPADKSTWNQKVAGNNDPNVWNGEGSKGKDNALWDDVPSSKDAEPVDQANTWNSQGPQPRTVSQSSGGENAETSWASTPAVGNGSSVTRSSPPNSIIQPSVTGEPNWGVPNGNVDPRKLNRWDSTPAQTPLRMNSLSDAGGASTYWDQGQGRPNGAPNNWNSKQSNSWSNDSPSVGSVSWGQSQSNAGGVHAGGWADGPSGNQWQSGPGSNRKPSFSWEDNQANGAVDYGRERGGRPMKSDPDPGDDADMGDWNESNSVWSSAGGFKQPRKHTSIPENHMPPPHMPPNSRMGGPGAPYGGGGISAPSMMHGGSGNMGGNGHMGSSKQQMISILMSYKFSKEDAHSALINNNMNMDAAIAELRANVMHQQMQGRPNDFGRGPPIGDNAYNPSIPPPNMPTNTLNTPFTNNAQLNQSAAAQASSRMNKPNQQRGGAPMARAQNHQQQQAIVKQLEMGVQMNNIHPLILHLPLHEHNVRLIQQLLTLQQTYQQQQESLAQLQRRQGPAGPHVEHYNRSLASLSTQMKSIQAPLIKEVQSQMSGGKFAGLTDSLAGLSLANNTSNAASSSSSQTSRLGIWTDKAPGSARQGAPANHSSSLHASHSTPNLHGGVLGDNSNPWSTSGGSVGNMWSSMSPSGHYIDNPNESHTTNLSNGPHSQSVAANSSQSFDIPEFVPGVPWQGASSHKVEDDPNITPGSVARSLSVSTATLNSGRSSTDLGWGNSKSTWSTAQTLGSPAAGELWSKGGGTRPPPGFGKNMNRSISMPQGPSEKSSAFSPVTGGWDSSQQTIIGSSPWLLLRNLSPHVDGNTLKTLCSQHGPLQSFFVNTNSGQALIRYTTKEEGLKAQKSLNSCNLYDATLLAEFVEDSEVQRIIDQCQRQGSGNIARSHSISAAPGSGVWPNSNNNYGSSSNLWGASGSVPAGGVASTWGTFLPTVDSNFAM